MILLPPILLSASAFPNRTLRSLHLQSRGTINEDPRGCDLDVMENFMMCNLAESMLCNASIGHT